MKKIAIIILNQTSYVLAKKIKTISHGQIHVEIHGLKDRVENADIIFTNIKLHVQKLFKQNVPIVAIMASGAIIRLLASVLKNKNSEPPVLIIDEFGKNIVPLLGGHSNIIGGNELAKLLAKKLKANAIISTAGELHFNVALDSPPKNWHLANKQHAKKFMANLLNGEKIQLVEENCRADWLHKSKLNFAKDAKLKIIATIYKTKGGENTLVFHPKNLVLGMGCERGVATAPTISFVKKIFKQNNMATKSLASLASIDIKHDELALLDVARYFNIEKHFFNAKTLELQKPKLKNPSKIVFKEVGCHGVCEGAALASTGRGGKLLVEKIKANGITAAIAFNKNPDKIKKQGRLSIIGIGPGTADWCSPEASHLITQAQDLVGYKLYLELLGEKKRNKKIHAFALGEEKKRVVHALSLAGQGRNVALICSGDAGIYAMASLVFETLDDNQAKNNEKNKITIQVAPGISALQAAAARCGAPLGHDFCAISLSDLLTPWQIIEKRIKAAAQADFVIAFYNPVSNKRKKQLAIAKTILLKSRHKNTPIILASNLGRPQEKITRTTLENLKIENVDMLTLVIVGSSQTRKFQNWIYTPRGYSNKEQKK